MKKYKYKLNMLEPGSKMIKLIGIFGIIGFVFYIVQLILLCYLFCGLAVITGIILFILLIIESHQDKVLYEQYIKEKRKNGED
jgi:hypothetical protein